MPRFPADEPRPPVLPLDAHLGHLDQVLQHARITRLLQALQRRREAAEGRAFGDDAR